MNGLRKNYMKEGWMDGRREGQINVMKLERKNAWMNKRKTS